jgi:hypothetical protein
MIPHFLRIDLIHAYRAQHAQQWPSDSWRNIAWVLKKSVNRNDLLVPKIAFRVLFLFR